MDDNAPLSAAELLELNRDIQGSPTVRLLAANNLGLYATLMERHLAGGVIPETELVVLLERDLDDLGHPDGQSGLALIKSWASQGWLHRVADTRSGYERNLCYLTQEARRALDFLRGMRRKDTIATGGSITGIASRLKQVAIRVGTDPDRIRAGIEAEIAALRTELDALEDAENRAGFQRPDADLTDAYDEARAIALQMERLITDIGQYGTLIEQATAALDEPIDSNTAYADRQRQMYADYQTAWDSQGRDSHRAFLRMINDPDQRAEFAGVVLALHFGLFTWGIAATSLPAALSLVSLEPLAVAVKVGRRELVLPALNLAMVSFVSMMLTARSFAAKNGYEIDTDKEFRALGMANLASAVSQGFAISGADSRTAVNDANGGKSQLVSIIAAAVIALITFYLTAPLQFIPTAALGVVLVMASGAATTLGRTGSFKTPPPLTRGATPVP